MKMIKVNDVECECELKEKKRKVRKRTILTEVFNDYCSSTSLHGIGYLGAEDKSFAEKVWWIIVFSLSLFVCIYLITRTWIKWTNDPVILSFEKEQIPIWDIPFPAVTICPVNKVQKSVYNYTEMFRNRDNLTEEESKQFWDISLVCNLEQYAEVLASFNCTYNITDEDAIENIVENAPNVYTIGNVKWQNKRMYGDAFANQITEEGLCFTFNSFGQEDMYTDIVKTTVPFISNEIDKDTDWSLEEGYEHKIKQTDYPRRTTKDGIASGLSFVLHSLAADTDYVCGMPISGYKIILHNPAEVPKAAQQYFLVPQGRKANIVIKPELTKTSKSLRSLPADTRKCYFSDEKSLKYFKVYTQSNCRMECNTNITLQYCDCVPFYLPRAVNTPICGFGSNKCIKEVERTILDLEMLDKGTNMTEEDKERIEFTMEIYNKCHCLPSCNNLEYSAEISQSEYHFVKTMLASGIFDEFLEQDDIDKLNKGFMVLTQVDIFFKESQFYSLKRSEIYGKVDFLANVGGLLGLFMGFSLLSLIEIIYFLTIRIWFKYKRSDTACKLL